MIAHLHKKKYIFKSIIINTFLNRLDGKFDINGNFSLVHTYLSINWISPIVMPGYYITSSKIFWNA